MKKQHRGNTFLWFLIPGILLSGCEVERSGMNLTFKNGNQYTNMSIGSFISIIAMVIIVLWYLFAVVRRRMIRSNQNEWSKTEATIVGNNVWEEEGNVPRSRHGVVIAPDVSVEYYADNEKYKSTLKASDLIGCDGKVMIEYQKKNPKLIRRARD